MSGLEWNPAFGPIGSSVIILGISLGFLLIFRHLARTQGVNQALRLLWPKMAIVALLYLALFDPTLKSVKSNATPTKIVVLEDISSSMDLADDGSKKRGERAEELIHQLSSFAPANVHLQTLPFDTEIHESGYRPKNNEERGTDLAGAIHAIRDRADLSGADAVVLVTDGGDETVELGKLPSSPLAIIGVGTDADNWNDIGIGSVNAPASIEEGADFDIEAEIFARKGAMLHSLSALASVKVFLEESKDNQWTTLLDRTVDLQSLQTAVAFHLKANGTGTHQYRLRIPGIPDELTLVNNVRNITVQIQSRAMHVLYFTQELGADYKYLRSELASDSGIVFTAMYRVFQDRFTVQGDQTGYQDLERGLPTDDKILQRYDCVILGSFAASLLSPEQMQALVQYVQNGGALIWLGGESSFGRGGYAGTKLDPLFPWALKNQEPELTSGTFPMTLSPSAASVGFTNGFREALAAAGSVSLDSINQPGELRSGAVGIFNVDSGGTPQAVVAVQHFGKGQVLGVATNTLWRWAAAGQNLKVVYGKFWRQSVRGLTQKMEGGSLLGIHWDQEHYRPGESALVEVRMQGASDKGALRLVGTLKGPDGSVDLHAVPVAGLVGFYQAKFAFTHRGNYTFHLSAYGGSDLLENYDRQLLVEPLIEEGASPELKESYLRDLATRSKGIYAPERDISELEKYLKEHIFSQPSLTTLPLVDFWELFPILVLLILLLEWFQRRRLNLI